MTKSGVGLVSLELCSQAMSSALTNTLSTPVLQTSDALASVLYVVDITVPAYMQSLYILVGTIGAAGNLFVFSILFKYISKKPNITESLLLHQAAVDEMTSIFVILTAALPPPDSFADPPSVWDDFVCLVWTTQLPLWVCFSTSCFNLVAITFEQYFEIVHPIFHKTRLRNLKPFVPVCLVWSCSVFCDLLISIPDSSVKDGSCLPWGVFPNAAAAGATGTAAILYYLVLPVSLMVGCFCHMAYVMHQRSNKTAPTGGLAVTFVRAKTSILKTLILFCITFVVCWSYNIWVWALSFFNVVDASYFTTFKFHISVLLLFLSCSINPFIYSLNYKKFRNGLKKTFAKCNKQQQQQQQFESSRIQGTDI